MIKTILVVIGDPHRGYSEVVKKHQKVCNLLRMEGTYKLLVKNAKQLVMIAKNHERMLCGKAMNNIAVIDNAYSIFISLLT